MHKKFAWLALLIGVATASVIGIYGIKQDNNAAADTALTSLEQAVTEIPIAGPLADRNAEVSSLAWYEDYLIILPQYPDRFGPNHGNLFALPKADILSFLNGQMSDPLTPRPIPLKGSELSLDINGFQGYEAIAFRDNLVFMTIEAESNNGMAGYLITGSIAEDLSQLEIDPEKLAQIQPQSASPNKADEALIIVDDQVMSIYEVNGAKLNPNPHVHVFDFELATLGTLPFPNLEYRLTDATALDSNNQFWAINYFFTGDRNLVPEQDLLAVRYGKGPTHRQQKTVERLVEFAYRENGITLTNNPPIQLELDQAGRNWEGIVRLEEKGFLIMTDKFPETILGFVAIPVVEEP